MRSQREREESLQASLTLSASTRPLGSVTYTIASTVVIKLIKLFLFVSIDDPHLAVT